MLKMDFIFVYVTFLNEKEAKSIVKRLLKQNLVACANFLPVKSMYKWEGKINEEKEIVVILKTNKSLFNSVKREISLIHSYSVPCITKIDVYPNQKYVQWLQENLI